MSVDFEYFVDYFVDSMFAGENVCDMARFIKLLKGEAINLTVKFNVNSRQ